MLVTFEATPFSQCISTGMGVPGRSLTMPGVDVGWAELPEAEPPGSTCSFSANFGTDMELCSGVCVPGDTVSMRIAVNRTGGSFASNRHVEIVDDSYKVTDQRLEPADHQPSERQGRLSAHDVVRLQELAARVTKEGNHIDGEAAGVDGAHTVVEVDDGSALTRIEIRRGRTTGQEVWDLLDVVDDVAAREL